METENNDHHFEIDLSSLPADGTLFEILIQELLHELGFTAERTGRGPDLGVDIIAETTAFDEIAGTLARRYVVECKHYANSARAVGLPDLHGLSIVDRITMNNAEGFLLACSTTITSGLREAISRLDQAHPSYHITYWDRTTIERKLQYQPRLVAKYFPSAIGRRVIISRPRGGPQRGCYDQVLDHQREFVGIKFIPKLYISRRIEDDILALSSPPRPHLLQIEKAFLQGVEGYLRLIASLPPIPEGIDSLRFSKSILAWNCNLRQTESSNRNSLARLRQLNPRLEREFATGGVVALQSEFERINHLVYGIQRDLASSVDFYLDAVEKLSLAENEHQDLLHKFRKPLHEDRQGARPKWSDKKALSGLPLQVVENDLPKSTLSPSEVRALLLRFKQLASQDVLAEVSGSIKTIHRSLQVIVDVAGSGKTNLSCKIALQHVRQSFVIFLTGRSYLKAFTNLRGYIQERIVQTYPGRKSYPLKDNCQWLYERNLPLLVILDGLNEAAELSAILNEFKELEELVYECPVRSIVTTRSEYWKYFEATIARSNCVLVRRGELSRFSEEELGLAIPAYLDHYKLRVRIEQRAWEQLKRPLLLRFFCEAYGDPGRKKFRELPPIRAVQLQKLFAEYCRVKYKNISNSLGRQQIALDLQDIEGVLLGLSREFLKRQAGSIESSQAKLTLRRRNRHSDAIYKALLDEDIIIDETPDMYSTRPGDRRVAFVYEAFMEYLIALVILGDSKSDVNLVTRLNSLFASEQEFRHIRGASSFLLPLCIDKFPRSFATIVEKLRDDRGRDVCIPALLNLWDYDWQVAVWPVIEVIASHVPMISLDDVMIFLSDWLDFHDAKTFLESIRTHPRTLLRLAGYGIVGLMEKARCDTGTLVQDAVQALIRECSNILVIEGLLSRVVLGRIEEFVNSESFLGLVFSCMPALNDIFAQAPHHRDWSILWLLGRIGARSNIRVPVEWEPGLAAQLRRLCVAAYYESAYRRDLVGREDLWWAEAFSIDYRAIETDTLEVAATDGRFWQEDEDLWYRRRQGLELRSFYRFLDEK